MGKGEIMIIKINFFRNTLHTYGCECGSDACSSDSECDTSTCDCSFTTSGNTETEGNAFDNSEENSDDAVKAHVNDSNSNLTMSK